MHPVGDQVMHLAVGFQYAIYGEYRCRQDFGALFFKQARPDHGVDEAGFIFQGQEDGAAGGHRSLAHCDQAAGAHAAAVRAFAQLLCGDGPSAPQDRPQQGNRMTAQGQAGAGVVGAGFVYFGGWADADGVLFIV